MYGSQPTNTGSKNWITLQQNDFNESELTDIGIIAPIGEETGRRLKRPQMGFVMKLQERAP